jgi:glycosyltransferase involved in cell wall biosynthesis
MTKTKILYIAHMAEVGGAEVCLLTLLKYLNKEKFEPVVVFPSSGPIVKKVEELGIKIHHVSIDLSEWWIREGRYFGSKSSHANDRINAISKIIETEKPDLVHTNTSVMVEGAIAARMQNVPHLWHLHEILEGHSSLKTMLPLPLVYSVIDILSDKIVTVSNKARLSLPEYISQEKVHIIHNGIDTEKYKEVQGPSIKEELGFSNDTTLCVTIGKLLPEKGHDDLLEAAAMVKKSNREISFLLVGGGKPDAEQRLNQRISDLGIGDIICQIGFRQDVPRIIKGSDILILPSLTEAFPTVVLEAMYAHKPVIATDCGGPAEMIENGKSGFIVPVRSPVDLSTKILELAQDKTKINAMGEKAFESFIERGYSAEAFAAKFEKLYLDMVNTKSNKQLDEKNSSLLASFIKVYQDVCSMYQYERELKEMQQSTSWKVTKLLRWIGNKRASLKGKNY